MASVLLIHLSDLHLQHDADPIYGKWEALCRAVESAIAPQTQACIIVFGGDAALSGTSEELALACVLLDTLRERIQEVLREVAVHIVTVPGNHDCNFLGSDQAARTALRKSLTSARPDSSIQDIMLRPLKEYFDFSECISSGLATLTTDAPFYSSGCIMMGTSTIRVHLLNSAYTSQYKDTPDLLFPLEELDTEPEQETIVDVVVMHHPLSWFRMPGVREEMRQWIGNCGDVVLTGHEHRSATSRTAQADGEEINSIEGGVLQEADSPELCRFNLVTLDLTARTQTVEHFEWKGSYFDRTAGSGQTSELCNPARRRQGCRIQPAYAQALDQIDDPITHPRMPELHLRDIFTYPDLRKSMQSSGGQKRGAGELIERIRSEDVATELGKVGQALILGGDRSGKTSISKRLFVDLYAQGLAPIRVEGRVLSRSGSEQGLTQTIAKAIEAEYCDLSVAEYEQFDRDRRVIIVDDFQDGPSDSGARRRLLDAMSQRFAHIILLASDEFALELVEQRGSESAAIVGYERYEICDFGHQRFEGLAQRWVSLGQNDPDPGEVRARARELTERVQSVLALAGLPHTPWLMIVMLEQTDQADAPFVAAKNGNYGHLYHAVITVALTKSRMTQFDLNGKFVYLGELAARLYRDARATLSDTEARAFHEEHCARYGLPFGYERVRDDLVDARMIRVDGDQIAFRSKWVYCFFVAWWLNRNLRKPEAVQITQELTKRVYHDTSANILVFLAHFTEDPVVMRSMRESASELFRDCPLATLGAEMAPLNRLDRGGSLFALPPTSPEVNRRLLLEAEDDRLARGARRSFDGRHIDAVPEADGDERSAVHDKLKEVRAALKTISILGQVLRNGITSIEEVEKQAILREVVGLGRRVLGYVFSYADQAEHIARVLRRRMFRIMVEAHVAELSAVTEEDNIVLKREELRRMWEDAADSARTFWFGMNWMAAHSVIKRMSGAVGAPLIDGTLAKLKKEAPSIPLDLLDMSIRLGRRARTIPADEMVKLHAHLDKEDLRIPKIVLEAMAWERLLLYETEVPMAQQICQQMGIRMPTKALDQSRKKFKQITGGKGMGSKQS